MPSILNNFVALRKTRGDVLDPASHRTIVEMILGILKRYNFDDFNAAFQSFVNHLVDYNDPHRLTDTSFLEEIIVRTYGIYIKMTATPVNEATFRSTIVPSVAFLELIRRIVLNRYLYDRIKNIDGSVPATVSVTLSREWGHAVSGSVPVALSFGSVLVDEDAFIARGWGVNATPIPVVFNADDLQPLIPTRNCILHISPEIPYFGTFDTTSAYPLALNMPSNDFIVRLEMKGTPTVATTVVSFLNGVQTLAVRVNLDKSIEIRLGTTLLHAAIPCNEGVCVIDIGRKGAIEVSALHNGSFTATPITADFSAVAPFVTALIAAPLINVFTTGFGIKELTVSREVPADD